MKILFCAILLLASSAQASQCEQEVSDIRSRLSRPLQNVVTGHHTDTKAGVVTTTIVYSGILNTSMVGPSSLQLVGYVKLDADCKAIDGTGLPVQ